MTSVTSPPADLLSGIPVNERWFAQPWQDEVAATEHMRTADAGDADEPVLPTSTVPKGSASG
jgi:hypothetical protein